MHNALFRPVRISTLVCLSLACLTLMGGCAASRTQSKDTEQRFGPARLTASGVQSEVMSFADTFASASSQIWNAISNNAKAASGAGGLTDSENAKVNRVRRASLEIKIANVNAAILIASSPNPVVSVADMVTLVTLQRMVLESPATAKTFGAEVQGQLVEVYKEQEVNVWNIAEQVMTDQQRLELRAMITQWRNDHPDATYVSSVRLEDFAAARQETIVPEAQQNQSLLAALSLDPLAGLDPAQREVTKSRMLAERVFFYASRMQNVLKWQVESLYQSLVTAPEFADVLRSAHKASDAAADLSGIVSKLPDQISKERTALLNQFFADLSKERSATIGQINEALSLQRKAALEDLKGAQGQFQDTLKDFRETAGSANTLAEKLTSTIKAADGFMTRFDPVPGAPAKPSTPGADPIADYKAAAERTGEAADRLTQLAKSLDQLLASPALNGKSAGLQSVVQEVQGSGRDLVNYAFWRLLIIVLAAPFAVVLAMGLYRRMVR